jgi:hypothetical protein
MTPWPRTSKTRAKKSEPGLRVGAVTDGYLAERSWCSKITEQTRSGRFEME